MAERIHGSRQSLEREGGSRRVHHVGKGISVMVWTTGCSSTAVGGILQCCRDAVCHQQGISVILSFLDNFVQRDCCSVQLLPESELPDCIPGVSGLI